MTEAQPNPYNRNKEWHNVKEKEFVSSESLFIPDPDAVRKDDDDPDDTDVSDATQNDPYKKRYDDLKKHYDSRMRDFKQQLDQLQAEKEAIKNESNTYKPPKTEEELDSWRKDNEELYAVIESSIYNRVKPAEDKLLELEKREKLIAAKEAAAEIRRQHPDFEDIKVSEDFHNWAKMQPQAIQDWVYNNPYDGILAAKAITLYKKEKGLETENVSKNEPDLDEDAASLLPTRSAGVNTPPEKKIWTNSEIAKMSMREYQKYEDEINLAYEEGRIKPD